MITETLSNPTLAVEAPDVANLITEDETPVDNLPSEKQQRLLVEPLYSAWKPSPPASQGEGGFHSHPFLAAANVGVFRAVNRPPVVPDMFLSLEVEVAENWWAKAHRSYFLWEFGKPPNVVVEIVSNREGQETGKKLQEYAQMGVQYYVIYDPQRLVEREVLNVYELLVGRYRRKNDSRLEEIGLGLTLWQGVFEGKQDTWLRWCDLEGKVIPTGSELAEQEWQRARQEHERAEQERERAERLAAQLRALGIEPEA